MIRYYSTKTKHYTKKYLRSEKQMADGYLNWQSLRTLFCGDFYVNSNVCLTLKLFFVKSLGPFLQLNSQVWDRAVFFKAKCRTRRTRNATLLTRKFQVFKDARKKSINFRTWLDDITQGSLVGQTEKSSVHLSIHMKSPNSVKWVHCSMKNQTDP